MHLSKPRFPFRLFALAFVFSIIATLIAATLAWQIHTRVDQMVEKHITMMKNVGRIMLLDEELTMSARMAAVTGDMGYERRYDQLDPQLTNLINEVRALLPQGEIVNFINETDAANAALVKMERQAFVFSREGRQQEAMALLASNEYSRLKDVYTGGLRKTVEAVDALIESENQTANYVLLSSVAASVLSVLIFILTWLLAVKSAKSWIDEHQQAEETLRESEAKLAEEKRRTLELIEVLPNPIYFKGTDGRYLGVNKAWETYFGRSRKEFLGKTVHELYPGNPEVATRLHSDDLAVWQHPGSHAYETVVTVADGSQRNAIYYKATFAAADGSVAGLIGAIVDITERKQMEDQVRQLAFYDALTKLPNRRLLVDRLSQAMAASKRSGCHGAMMFLDLDKFKSLNDAHGHDVGDLLLVEASNRLKRCVREVDTVARFGGDEFVVMIIELDAGESESAEQAGVIAQKIRAALAEPYLLHVRHDGAAETTIEHQCTASIGVALFGKHETSQEDILKWADTAMYQAKGAGSNLIRFHDPKARVAADQEEPAAPLS